MLSDPAVDVPQTSPIVDHSVAEAMGEDAQERQADVVLGDSDSDVGGGFDMGGWDYDAGGVDDHSSLDEGPEPIAEPTVTATVHRAQADDRLPRGLKARKKQKRISQHGIEYPPLPPAFVKRVAQTALQSSGLSNQRLSAETLDALIQASEWFFEQLGDDLGAYADHAKRKTIEESDVFTLMKRYVDVSLGISSFFVLARNSNMVQATPDRTAFLHVFSRAEAPPERTDARAENACPAARQTATCQASAGGRRRGRGGRVYMSLTWVWMSEIYILQAL
jgi:histone H3/H4